MNQGQTIFIERINPALIFTQPFKEIIIIIHCRNSIIILQNMLAVFGLFKLYGEI